MSTKRYAYKEEAQFITEPEWTAAQIARLHRISDTQGGGALEAFGVGVLPDPDENSLQVTDAGGLDIQIAAGRGFGRHSTYGGFFLQLEAPLSLSGLAPSSTLYIFAAIDVSVENDTRETGAPQIVIQAGSSLDGGLPLAEITTSANDITGLTDLRQFVTLGGSSGSVWRTGSGAPSDALGANGDFYLNSANGDFYKKESGAYALQGNLKGAPGAAGTNGADGQDGATARFGTGAPDNGTGNDGDFYVDNSSGALYLKAAGAWVFQTNLTGPQGIPGGVLNWIEAGWQSGEDYEVNDGLAHGTPASSYRATVAHTSDPTTEPGVGAAWASYWMVTAAAGAAGATGAGGTTWHSGTAAPASGLGADGDFYFNTATADVYKKISGAWAFQVNLKGVGVPAGGASGSALIKSSATDYATSWATPTALITGVGVGGVLSGSLPNPGFAVDMATQSELDAALTGKQSTSEKGVANGYAELDGSGKVPSAQLPAFVDDVIEAANFAALPGTGETGKIYVTLDDNKTFRWSGSAYVEISASLALGETSATAYRGDRGAAAYDHSQATGNPHGTVIGDISGLQDALDNAGGGSGIANERAITQAAHGLSLGNWVKFDSVYAKAQADAAVNAEVLGVVTAVADTDNFTLASDGYVSGLSGLTVGLYYLDPTTAGAMTPTEPATAGQVSRPVFFAVSAMAGYILNYRGYVVPESGGGGSGGDMAGPSGATDNALARYDSTTGKLLQNSAVTLSDAGAFTVPEIGAPDTPASGTVAVYAKSDGNIYSKDDTGTEQALSGGAHTAANNTWGNAQTFDATVIFNGDISIPATTPATLTADTNQVVVTNSPVMRLSSDAARAVHGLITAGSSSPLVLLINIGSYSITLKHESGAALNTGDRMISPTGADYILAAGATVWVYEDSVSARWRILS